MRLQDEIASSIAELSPEQLMLRPPGKWCVGEILEHLYLTYTGTIKGFERVEQAGKSEASAPTLIQRGRTLVVVTFGYMPSGRESPAVARPRGMSTEKILSEIGSKISAMDEIMARCSEKFGIRCKLLDHPVLGPLSVTQWKKFHFVHGLHHVKQIRRLREYVTAGTVPRSIAS